MRIGGTSPQPGRPCPAVTGARPSQVGTILNQRYRIDALLGAGSFGRVYRATDLLDAQGPSLAIKEVFAHPAATPDERGEAMAWFRREVGTLLSLDHPGIPAIHAYWIAERTSGPFYLAMDYIPGQTLAQLQQDAGGPLPWQQVLRWGLALCDVLAYLHGSVPPVLFRDLKLSNVILDSRTNTPALIDFGIARQLGATGGTAIGTGGYAPMEQWVGKAEPRSDLYALGATLHALLTGRNPEIEFVREQRSGKSVEEAMRALFPVATTLVPDIPAALAEALACATAFAADERFPDAGAMADALRRVGAPTGSMGAAVASTQPSVPATSSQGQPSTTPVPASPAGAAARPPQAAATGTRGSHGQAQATTAVPAAPPIMAGKGASSAAGTRRHVRAIGAGVAGVLVLGAILAVRAEVQHSEDATRAAASAAATSTAQMELLWQVQAVATDHAGRLAQAYATSTLQGTRLAQADAMVATQAGQLAQLHTVATTAAVHTGAVATALMGRLAAVGAAATAQSGRLATVEAVATAQAARATATRAAQIRTADAAASATAVAARDAAQRIVTAGTGIVLARAMPTVAPSHLSSGTITEFSIPTANAGPEYVTTGADGNLWFAEYSGSAVGRITPDGRIVEFPLPALGGTPQGLTLGADGNLWFTSGAGAIGRIAPDGRITEFPFPPGGGIPRDLTVGPDGNLWFGEYSGSAIGRITPDGHISTFALPSSGSNAGNLTAALDGNLWFTVGPDIIGRITPFGHITEFPLPVGLTGAGDLTIGPDGNLWFTDVSGTIGRIDPGGAVTEFTLPVNDHEAADLTVGLDGNLWFTSGAGAIGRITPDGHISTFALPTGAAAAEDLISGTDGSLWFIEDASTLGRITLAGQVSSYALPTLVAEARDLTIGPDGNLWFAEYGANKIGRLILAQPSADGHR